MITLAEHEAKIKIREDLIKELEKEKNELLDYLKNAIEAIEHLEEITKKANVYYPYTFLKNGIKQAIAKSEGK